MRIFKHLDHISLHSTGMGNQKATGLFVCLYLGYMIVTYIRKSVSLASPVIMEAENIDKSQIGLVLSSQTLGYSVSKFLGGVLADIVSPSRVFITVLFLAGFTVLAFTVVNEVPMFVILWFVNGLSIGPTWPACALLIKRWFPAERFGTWWTVLSTSMNVSGTVGPLVSAYLLSHYTWRFSLNVIGSSAVALAAVSVLMLSDQPPQSKSSSTSKTDTESSHKQSVSWTEGMKALLLKPVFVGTCLNYLFVSLIRGACSDWGQLYLIDKGHSRLTGSSFISSQELGGVVGSLFAGYVSDYFLSKNLSSYNPRLLVILLCSLIQSVSILLFITTVSSSATYLLITVIGFLTGFGMFGCIALFGVVAMESTSDQLAGSAHAVAALAANIGLVLSGYPLSLVAKQHDWHTVFLLVLFASGAAVVVTALCVLRSANVKTEKLHKS